MKLQQQFWHLVKFQFLAAPLQVSICIVFFLLGSYSAYSSMGFDGVSWDSHPRVPYIALFYSWMFLWGLPELRIGGVENSTGTAPRIYLWTRALDRNYIFWSKFSLYAVLCMVTVLPVTTLLLRPQSPFQVSFQGEHDNPAFQKALLSDPSLGTHQFYDHWHNILIEIPHGRELTIGLWALQFSALSLAMLAFATLRMRGKWMIVGYAFILSLMIVPSLMGSYVVNHMGQGTRGPDVFNYKDQFMIYANYQGWAWLALALFGIFIIWNARRNFLRPS